MGLFADAYKDLDVNKGVTQEKTTPTTRQKHVGPATPIEMPLTGKMAQPLEGHMEDGVYVPAVRPVTKYRSLTERQGKARIDS